MGGYCDLHVIMYEGHFSGLGWTRGAARYSAFFYREYHQACAVRRTYVR